MKIIKIHLRENIINHANPKISIDNHENHENPIIQIESYENRKQS